MAKFLEYSQDRPVFLHHGSGLQLDSHSVLWDRTRTSSLASPAFDFLSKPVEKLRFGAPCAFLLGSSRPSINRLRASMSLLFGRRHGTRGLALCFFLLPSGSASLRSMVEGGVSNKSNCQSYWVICNKFQSILINFLVWTRGFISRVRLFTWGPHIVLPTKLCAE